MFDSWFRRRVSHRVRPTRATETAVLAPSPGRGIYFNIQAYNKLCEHIQNKILFVVDLACLGSSKIGGPTALHPVMTPARKLDLADQLCDVVREQL
jgi:hypothetical protein